MDDLASSIDSDVLIDLLDDQEGSDLDDDDEEFDEPLQSPLQLLSSGPGSTTTSITSSPPNNEDFIQPFNLSGKPFTSIKRGRGRPRREGGKPIPRKSGGQKGRRVRLPGVRGGGPRRVKSIDKDYEPGMSLNDDLPMLDPETGAFVFSDKSGSHIGDDMPYAPENWPGKVCAFCNLGERSQLGQGEFLRLNCPEGFVPQRRISETPPPSVTTPERESGDKSPRGPVTCRRQKSFNKCRHPSLTSEYVDELTIIGYNEEPDVSQLFENNGHFYVHRNCALWSWGVKRTENEALENVGPVVLQSSSKKCSFCNHYGASLVCKLDGCAKNYHFPCATASGGFQDLSTLNLYCNNHIGHASLCESSFCYTCKTSGDIANLMFCSSCGEHYHGICVGLAQLPGVRAGWQCRKCRICQVCRMTGDESKLMTCEQCDKIYHAACQRPIVTTIPKYGWKCRCCRVCGDCGSRTPGAGLSSRWHAHYTVCDSCYQQRNKGFCCPICKRAYRAHAHREMVQCTSCNKFVHGTCDPDADLSVYKEKKDSHPDYEYVCLLCRNSNQIGRPITTKRNSIEESGESLSGMADSFFDDAFDFENSSNDTVRNMGLGKGKPYSASKIAKKRLGYPTTNLPGRPKGWGKGAPGKVGFMKRQRLNEFGRKRGPKAKMRGIFGVPGVGLQRPISDGKNDDEPGGENRLVLCSARDKFMLTQDICVMCGALGTDQEGCLIACVQCGQCYHPYCGNVKVTKVILQKGWRCLDCTVCEGCGERNDEPRLILCDDCDISYHIYCMDPPLEDVPHGTWKCKWCAICQTCGSTDPGFNCTWMNSYSECGPCASHTICASCSEPYNDGELIIQCVQCERWLHGTCDSIKTEEDAEKCADDGYNCLFCRPRDVPPPHLVPLAAVKPPTPCKSPEVKSSNNYFLDGIYLSETGHCMIKSLVAEHHATRKKRKKLLTSVQDKEAGIMATIESVVAGGSIADNHLDGTAKIEMVDVKDESMQEAYKEGMLWTKEDGPPPEGFTIFTMENGASVLRRKRQRNLQKMGIGGFLVRVRGIRSGQDNDDVDILPGQTPGIESNQNISLDADKPRRKPIRRKPKSKLSEMFPPYLQEAFFGKDLLDNNKELASSSSDEEKVTDLDKSMQFSQDEIKKINTLSPQKDIKPTFDSKNIMLKGVQKIEPMVLKEEEEENTEELKDVLSLSGDLLDNDLVKTLINEDDDNLEKTTGSLQALTREHEVSDSLGATGGSKDTKDELSDILGSHFNLDAISNINSKDVEDIFKGVLTDESQESQESNTFPLQTSNIYENNPSSQPPIMTQQPIPPAIRPNTLPNVQNNLNSPLNFPSHSPYHSEYSNSPQFSPAFNDTTTSWVSSVSDSSGDMDAVPPSGITTYNQRSSEKMKADESLGSGATISAVLYANMNHPEWKIEYPNWNDRYKQMIKKWRTLSTEQKAPYLQQARDNRSVIRMKKQQQSQNTKDSSETTTMPKVSTPTPPASTSLNLVPQSQPATLLVPNEDQDKMTSQHKSAREAEQERQWKQLQAMRQQQAQQQQHVIHEQRVQAINRAQRPAPDINQSNFLTDLQPKTPSQELSPVTSPSGFQSVKSPSFTHANVLRSATPMTPSHSANLDFVASTPSSTSEKGSEFYSQQGPAGAIPFQQGELFEQQVPNRPPSQFTVPARAVQPQSFQRSDGPSTEVNNHLRDLLQRQTERPQFKRVDEHLLAGKGHQRLWPPSENQEGADQPPANTDVTFRQPLPPAGIPRPRTVLGLSQLPRQGATFVGLRMQPMQTIDTRMRLLMQQQQIKHRLSLVTSTGQVPPQFQNDPSSLRFPAPQPLEQFEQNTPQSKICLDTMQNIQPGSAVRVQRPASQVEQTTVSNAPVMTTNTQQNQGANEQEIPDNVTAEIEKLEQETGTMVELQVVGDILGGLGDDDDELLAEMGADFNILEYADPELEALAGEKTNILDMELEEEPMKKERERTAQARANVSQAAQIHNQTQPVQTQGMIRKESAPPPLAIPTSNLGNISNSANNQQQENNNSQPPLLALQHPNREVPTINSQNAAPLIQQIHLQMLQQVQQAAAQNRPMAPGSRLQTPDGVTGIVTANNSVQLHVPPTYQKILMTQLQTQKLQMRARQIGPGPRMVNPTEHPQVNLPMSAPPTRMAGPPPPPPPYPGPPPPPYPGAGPSPNPQQEQPLLLEDLLEQEKREQEKQNQTHGPPQENLSSLSNTDSALLSDHDFERLKADVFSSNNIGINPSSNQAPHNMGQPNQWQNLHNQVAPQPPPVEIPQVQLFNINLLPAPPLPPENIVTDQDRHVQMVYEQWLNQQNNILQQQLKYYDTEVQKLRKSRKSLNSKQRQLKKSGSQLTENDANELQRIATEQSILQKHLESSRKQTRQHSMLIQEYRNKQAKQNPTNSPHVMNHSGQSPLGPPGSSPIHHTGTSQSPLMSPSGTSPITQHGSPMHSPGQLINNSPGPGSVSNFIQSPSGSMTGNSMSPMQPSPRIGTPHSQNDSPVHSPQMCLPPPVPRMTSPQHRKIVTSPVAYSTDIRQGAPQMRYVRTEHPLTIQHRVVNRLPSPLQQKPRTPSPLNSPPPQQQLNITHQLLQKQLHQQVLLQQQQNSEQPNNNTIAQFQRAAQLMRQRNMVNQVGGQPQTLTPQQHQMLLQQQQQLAKQQQMAQMQSQARINQQQNTQMPSQARISQQQNIQSPKSPMPPKSPLVQQIMSPHSMPPSPMPPRSPMVVYSNNPNSPMAKSPGYHQGMQQNPNSPMNHPQPSPSPMPKSPMINPLQSPMSIRRPPSSPAIPERPISVENPGTPRSYMDSGGGNSHNSNMLPLPIEIMSIQNPKMGLFGGSPHHLRYKNIKYFKPGLRGGAPMWNLGRGAKRVPTPPVEKNDSQSSKNKKNLYINKVGLFKKKTPSSGNDKLGSLVSLDYNDLDDSSSTPPVTPPPTTSTNRIMGQKMSGKRLPDQQEVIVLSNTSEDIMDYDDDNNTVLSTEVSLNSAAQNDEDIAVMETLSQSDLTDVMSSPLESVQISDEYLLFHENMVDLASEEQYSDKEVEEVYGGDNMHIVIRSPTTSDDELLIQEKNKKYMSSDQLLLVTDLPGSPEHEEILEDSPEIEETPSFDDTEMVVMEQPSRISEEQISTKEDFEELIDEGSKKQKILKPAMINVDFHKYVSSGYNVAQTQMIQVIGKTAAGVTQTKTVPLKQHIPHKVSLITTPVIHANLSKEDGAKLVSAQNRTNVLIPKLGRSVPPVITIVSAGSSQMSSIIPTGFTVPVLSASTVRQLTNVKVISKPSTSLSVSHDLPKKIFEDDSVSPDSSNCEDDKKDSSDEKSKTDSPPAEITKTIDFPNIREPMNNQKDLTPQKLIKVQENSKIKSRRLSNIIVSEQGQRETSPIITKTSSPVIIHNTPELKMTAQIVQDSQSSIHVARQEGDGYDVTGSEESKSVVISIPSPTPSQEQMLDNMSLQVLENRRREGKAIPSEFESFEEVLDMLENFTGETTTVLDDAIKEKPKEEAEVAKPPERRELVIKKDKPLVSQPSNIPQLSPLSQPTDLTTNMANASQQLRNLLSLHTTSTGSSINESIVKSSVQKTTTPSSTTSVVTSRIIHVPAQNTSISSVIVPNLKQSTVAALISNSKNAPTVLQLSNSMPTSTSEQNIRCSVPIKISQESVPVFSSPNSHITSSMISSAVNQKIICSEPPKSLSLTAMLQSHPAASPSTYSSADAITAASLLTSAVSLSKEHFNPSLVQAQPNLALLSTAVTSSNNSSNNKVALSIPSTAPPLISTVKTTITSNFLHTQLTKVIKKVDVKSEDIKQENKEMDFFSEIKSENCVSKNNVMQTPPQVTRNDDSQNVLLKKLLQNTGCASTQSMFISTSPSATTSSTISQSSTSIDTDKSTPTLSSLLPSLVKTEPNQQLQERSSQPKLMSRETSFVSSPVQSVPISVVTSQQLHIDVKKNLPPSRTPSRDDLLSPQTPKSTGSQDSTSLQTPPLIIKKELTIPQSPFQLHQEIKKEYMDETSQHSEVSDHSRPDIQLKEELENMDTTNSEKHAMDQKEEMKKQKRRLYQQKRRQNQNMNKDGMTGQPKKRPRKSSKVDEDYDTYTDSVLAQLRTLPAMNVQEPFLNKNFGVVSVYGSGDLSRLCNQDYDSRFGDLKGSYGNAILPDYLDYYSTKPFGDFEPLPEKPQPSTQRGFYDKEFPPIKFDNEENKRFDLFSREDTPDSIVSSSSPECVMKEPFDKFMGLKLIDEDADEESPNTKGRLSPIIPIIVPKPIRLKVSVYNKELEDVDKENIFKENTREQCTKPSKYNSPPNIPSKDSGNVTVTLTLTSSAAENIMGVLRDLANILQIPAPTSYQIIERTSTPPSQKLGMYRTKGKDGREGAPIDIQSILNGAAKFCKHCDVVILNNMIKKKVSELPFLFKDSELLGDGDDLYFCSTTCYMQFALMHRSPSISEDKVAAIVDHLCQKDKKDLRQRIENIDPKHRNITSMNVSNGKSIYEDKVFDMFNKSSDLIKSETYQSNTQSSNKSWKGIRYKIYSPGCIQPNTKYKKLTDKEMMELLYKMGVTLMPPKGTEDTRKCIFCHAIGDGVADGPGRLLNFDVDKWVHLNCGLWSEGVYETVNGALMNLDNAFRQSFNAVCIHCHNVGAKVRCFKNRCTSVYHLNCAVKDNCVFYKNKTTYCSAHIPKNEKDNELTTLSVSRRVYINRDENRQVASVMHHSDNSNLLRVGSLIFLNVGQILPHQLQNFHTSNYIYPIGYKIIRFFWSIKKLNKRCKYICEIMEDSGRPKFCVTVQDPPEEDIKFADCSPKAIWLKILEELANLRKQHMCVKNFPKYVNGEDLFGLNEPAVVRVLESLPGIDTLTDYKFKYGKNPLLELPLAINPSGAARSEPKLKNQQHWKRHHTQRSAVSSIRPVYAPTPPGPNISTFSESSCPYSKQFVHTKSSQYKKMKQEWRNNVYLGRSKIQGLGLYAARDLEKHTMVIEYIGEIIRTELAETREKKYEARNRGIYMFRLDEERVIDATLSGGLARYINHSCNPNCVAETVEVDRDLKIIIFAKRRIQRGEELSYDYKFDIEDDQHKISCMCGAPNCRKWMN